jgi:HEAT repeat protein
VVIKTSSGKEIAALVAGLSADCCSAREAAVARLTVIGARAVERLVEVASSDAPALARAAAFRALEAIGDRRGFDAALRSLDDTDPSIAAAAASAVRPFLRGAAGAIGLDRLAALALDAARDAPGRLAAMQALADLDSAALAPLWTTLRDDKDASVRAYARERAAKRPAVRADPAALLEAAADGLLPEDAGALRQALAHVPDPVAVTTLLRLVQRIRERESLETGPRRDEWTMARAAAHAALAARGSRLALYDLRESLEATTAPLPVEFLAALSAIGDASCLESIAAANARWSASGHAERDWWRRHLIEAFRAIVSRERLTRRHAVMKKIEKRWPGTG